MNKNKLKIIIILLLGLLLVSIVDNNSISTNYYNISSKKIPRDFDNFKILQISDLHNKDFPEVFYKGKDEANKSIYNPKLIDLINAEDPDIIIVTGDLIDSRSPDEDIALDLLNNITNKYPVYYISGNHEERSGKSDYYKEIILKSGAKVLANETIDLYIEDSKISLTGVDDYISFTDYRQFKNTLRDLKRDNYNILLSHRSSLFETYVNAGYDLSFSGHAHGGQIRLPILGGLLSPDQGLFPQYDSGLHTRDNSSMIISRGLGNSIFPLRIYNRPELVVTILRSEE